MAFTGTKAGYQGGRTLPIEETTDLHFLKTCNEMEEVKRPYNSQVPRRRISYDKATPSASWGRKTLGLLLNETAGLPGKGNPAVLGLERSEIFLAIGKEVIPGEHGWGRLTNWTPNS